MPVQEAEIPMWVGNFGFAIFAVIAAMITVGLK